MKILVTGALGFIGSNITERLVREGHEVVAVDNMHTGDEANLAAVKGKVKVAKMDAGGAAALGERFDAIFHQGIYSSTPMYKEDPSRTAKVIADWIGLMEYARKNETKIVFASSSSLYNGNPPPHREDMDIKVTDFYTEARYMMERLARLYNNLYGVKSVGLRYFSVYGPHERAKGRYANLITQFLWDMQAGRQPLILGDGTQTRDFTYVDDVVDANMLALRYDKRGCDVFNVGTGKSITLNGMAKMLAQKLRSDIKPRYESNPIKNYVQHTLADTHKASSLLGFRAKIPLEKGIELLIQHYKV